ncbi:MAG: DNA-binding protein WhiA [Oscillospiraceae bacterium]|nr:DNA-binding protein WhiA [Oscillospiraceae bacterium]MBR4192969.1 DNA-binding protein WhiA [Oscillospiraceae bacterium]
MSFSSDAKAELCREFINKKCCALAEACGVLLYSSGVSGSQIRVVTESPDFAARLPQLFHKAFRLDFDECQEGAKYAFLLHDPEKITKIFEAIGYSPTESITLHVNYGLLEKDCCRRAFLRGAFLSGGSVTDPVKRYHLELATNHHKVSRETEHLLSDQGFAPKAAMRNGSSILYFKQSEAIEDFLAWLGAPVASMGVMEAKIEKDMKNKINRIVNCDNANTSKVVEAAQAQIAAIRSLREQGKYDSLPDKLKQTAELRENNPDANLMELAELFDPPLTKSALNHRLRKLCELAADESG